MTLADGGVYSDEREFKRLYVRLRTRMTKAGVAELLGPPLSMGTGFGGSEGSNERSAGEWWIYAVQQQDGRLFFVLGFDNRGELTRKFLESFSRNIETRKAQGRARPLIGAYPSVERLVGLASAIGVGSSRQEVEATLGLPLDARFGNGGVAGSAGSGDRAEDYWVYAGGSPHEKVRCWICFDSKGRVVSKHLTDVD